MASSSIDDSTTSCLLRLGLGLVAVDPWRGGHVEARVAADDRIVVDLDERRLLVLRTR